MGEVNRFTDTRTGHESGISGKELRFQQNQNFGPGAMKPYVGKSAKARVGRSQGQESGSFKSGDSRAFKGRGTYPGGPEESGLRHRVPRFVGKMV